jgi:hypothetical protein
MAVQRLIVAIGRIERALSRLEQMPATLQSPDNSVLAEKHEKLKAETRLAIDDIDKLLATRN